MAYSSLATIEALLEGSYSSNEIKQALADLEAMYKRGSINEYQYKNMKALLEDKL